MLKCKSRGSEKTSKTVTYHLNSYNYTASRYLTDSDGRVDETKRKARGSNACFLHNDDIHDATDYVGQIVVYRLQGSPGGPETDVEASVWRIE